MLALTKNKLLKGFKLQAVAARNFSGAAAISDRFQAAWLQGKQSHASHEPEPKNKKEYGSGYIQRHNKRLRKGYTHPYHSREHPLFFSSVSQGWDVLSNLVGPEQVSPHYESLSRSRRGIIFIFAYIGAITNIARLGGWDNNEWIRGLVFHSEYLVGMYVGYSEIRHFAYLPGPKFSIFYDVYSRYEAQQLAAQWNDTAEELQHTFYAGTREQVEYMRIHNEYQFIKKRSLINFLTNERLNLEKHFHDRTLAMLTTISNYETQNLKNKLSSIAQESYQATIKKLESDAGEIKSQAFEAALDGIRKGSMDFAKDPILPILKQEIAQRTNKLRNLSAEEESKILMLSKDQRASVIQMDKGSKDNYLTKIPHITSQGLKSQEKFLRFTTYLTSMNKKDS